MSNIHYPWLQRTACVLKKLNQKTHQHPSARQQSRSCHWVSWGQSSSPGSRTRPALSHWRCLSLSARSAPGHTWIAWRLHLPSYRFLLEYRNYILSTDSLLIKRITTIIVVVNTHLCRPCGSLTGSPPWGQVHRHRALVLTETSGCGSAGRA